MIFKHALHEGYDGLNPIEREFARALDPAELTWCRNPACTGYGIPSITLGSIVTFYPDFLVWVVESVLALDTKGEHLLLEAAGSELLAVRVSL